MASLENVKLILDINDTSKDSILNLYIARSTNFVKNYCNIIEIPESLNGVIEDITVFYYRNKGVENIQSEGKGSLSESYIKSLPVDIISELNNFARVKFI
ncbi:phage head-tail connector protein [Schinkia azotoformans]|uniref:phage head-tail connector protein n=1 Tax=Schinkia azotoformans TaxID=1454 RepID=UPI002DBBCA4E|nr:phage head-tail connector protein [Schinkia azotoformans]MEC1726924.1 phage head-tail connector protein [Schinkia azotoformans]MEC1772832.1 phage head-tail connector protein [Schinkia azotoformans]MED4367449.1 phage head-tail connector protein [Schinkia azotoformans]